MKLDALAWQQKKEWMLLTMWFPLTATESIWPKNWNRDMMSIPIGNYGRDF
jgi:hypothetical protein